MKEVQKMNSKLIKIVFLAVVIIALMSVGLYAAYSFSQAKTTTTSITSTDDSGSNNRFAQKEDLNTVRLKKVK